jgi:ATP-dependent helicase/nuclease subunit A
VSGARIDTAATNAAQARASDPNASAWVNANAGSGKTHVLVHRVLRLLLGGCAPARILCLTFTKAAAANMAERVTSRLSEWTRLSDADLAKAIVKTGAPSPGPKDLATARRLFARTVETPGGLKIQTIHAFCERLLHLFPFEANVAAGFSVIVERDADLVLEIARGRALAILPKDPEKARHLTRLSEDAGAQGVGELLREALALREIIHAAVEDVGGIYLYGATLAALLGLTPDETEDAIAQDMMRGRAKWAGFADVLDEGSTNDGKLAAHARAAAAARDDETALRAWLLVFFTKKDEPRGSKSRPIITSTLEGRRPGLLARMQTEQARLEALKEKARAARIVARTVSLLTVLSEILDAYARAKAARGVLDFADLIERTRSLLSRSDARWVLYKLDSGIDHILVDEAQDTSEEQWDILARITEDFFAGAGARANARTFFAVGDEKQSIFSFQGAAPAMFAQMRRDFERRHKEALLPFNAVTLSLSFRSAQSVLDSLDAVFAQDHARRDLTADGDPPPPHVAFHASLPGIVELWEPIAGAGAPNPADWRMPLDAASMSDPPVELARRIALVIAQWLAPGSPERVHDNSSGGARPIHAGDILILVRARGPFFEAMIRALKSNRVPAAGADRLRIVDEIAVQDLIAVGRAALTPDDDLALACVLKSPLIGLDDDDLLAIAPKRAGSLADALAASGDPKHRRAHRRIEQWRLLARALSPFDFYARMLGAEGGRRALVGRLGFEASDAIDEFVSLALAHERSGPPSLLNFLEAMSGANISIKRDMDAAGAAVRVMTVHGAKGLEAPIVFLPDTCSEPTGRGDARLMLMSDVSPPLIAWSARAADDPPALAAVRQAARDAAQGEHRRLLYVAMTRAAERLIVAGFHGVKGRGANAWWDMVHTGLKDSLATAPAPWDKAQTILRRGDQWLRDDHLAPPAAPAATLGADAPDWLARAAPAERGVTEARASSRSLMADPDDPTIARRLEEGRLVHILLQRLPDIAPDRRAEAASRFLAARIQALGEAARSAIVARILAILDDPRLGRLFGPGSRAEVPIAARDGAHATQLLGRVDRLAVEDDVVTFADFKNGALPKDGPPHAYVAQMAVYRDALARIYPRHRMRAMIVFVGGPAIVEL